MWRLGTREQPSSFLSCLQHVTGPCEVARKNIFDEEFFVSEWGLFAAVASHSCVWGHDHTAQTRGAVLEGLEELRTSSLVSSKILVPRCCHVYLITSTHASIQREPQKSTFLKGIIIFSKVNLQLWVSASFTVAPLLLFAGRGEMECGIFSRPTSTQIKGD